MVQRITLRERMRRALRIRNMSRCTEQVCLGAAASFAAHLGRPPDQPAALVTLRDRVLVMLL